MFARSMLLRTVLSYKGTVSSVGSKRGLHLPPAIKEKVPIYGAIVGTMALFFQVAVLYPWHEEFSEQFEAVEVSV